MSVFLSSAPEDIAHRDALVRHLDPLRRAGKLRLWHDGLLKAGEERAVVAREELDRAAVVLLLVSADYLSSEERRVEMDRALARARARDTVGRKAVRVVPILLRPCLSGVERIAGLASLPTDSRPVTAWPDSDSAWTDVAHGIAALLGGASFERSEEAPFLQAENDRLRLLKKLEDAHARRRRLAAAKGLTTEIDAEILKLKRELRDGGQVRQGDILQGRYTLLRRIGRGGFATVWEAEDREQHTHVAVKILHADLAGDAIRRERFFRGARIMTELDHDAIVRILATEQQDAGFHYLVMELMAGGDLQAAVLEGRIPPDRIVPLITRVGEALIAAHEHALRFIHRDVKPANILLDENGEPKLGDFDLVGGKETTGGTRTGAMGSFVYAAPEMLSRPQDADARADVFGLGMTALYCFYGKKLPDIAFRKPERVLAELGRPRIEAVLAKAVEWEPSDRYSDVRSFCAALREAEEAEKSDLPRAASGSASAKPSGGLGATEPELIAGRFLVLGELKERQRGINVLAAPAAMPPKGTSPPNARTPTLESGELAPAVESAKGVESAASSGVSAAGAPVGPSSLAPRPALDSPADGSAALAPSSTPLSSGSGKATSPIAGESISPSRAKPGKLIGGVMAALLVVIVGIYEVVHASGAGSSSGAASAGVASTTVPETTSATTESATTAIAAISGAPAPSPTGDCPFDMVRIVPPAQVWIGSKEGVGESDEHPRHQVPLGPYCMDKTEVTVAAYAKCVDKKKCPSAPTPYRSCNGNKPDRQAHPINCVTLDESEGYCKFVGRRLPSEEEWEFAARGPTEREYPWGSAPPSDQLCWDGEGSDLGKGNRQSTCPVGRYHAGDSPFGLSDMAGNVWEWTTGAYCPYMSKSCSEARHVVRGGSWYSGLASNLRGALRSDVAPSDRGHYLGFRCAKD